MTRYEYVERYLQPKINDELYHHGILGMKWGVRRYQNEDGSLTPAGEKRYARLVGEGDKVRIYERNKSFLGKIFDKEHDKSGLYDIYDKTGNEVGSIFADAYEDDAGKTHKNTEHIDWIGIDDKYQRRGYGKEALDIFIKDCSNRGREYVRLEAAGIDPAAKHIYEKRGFEVVGKTLKDPIWNELTPMRLKIS